ncbi:MAG: histidine kinase N-terminal 7TM domain-containing protein [Methanosarcina sp.]|uniref:histidine kinase N-terminal 7TM domain-containing protein n=1 Tax=Methanosarcina sp. TaxID=2213 RepID=UPI00261E64B9|nr:histidine kinase N-terminal 7TM domain-containing protein [Methanosarcina sp.]MDD3246300.1 histidine kinase N-terminal 7TM domain-containing protein [Methanosarcina sp.]MDD4247957.1 histidine kinase N-terminal 7TM domain-containing protein [Methanosarcina sp.]
MGVLILSGLISTLLAIKAYNSFNSRSSPFAKHFILIMLCMALWSVNYAFEIGFVDIEYKYIFARLQYLGIAFVPVAWFLFAAEYSGVCRQFARKYEKLLFLFPCLTILMMLTNSIHGLYFEGFVLDYSGEFPLLVIDHGPFFWTFYIYSFVLLMLGIISFFKQFVNLTAPHGTHAAIALTAACFPVLANILHIADIGPFEFIDPTPFSFTITGFILFWGTIQHKFLNIIPVARESVIESMNDGYIVVDLSNSIVDINKAALELAGKVRKEALGKNLNGLFGEGVEILGDSSEGGFGREISLKSGLETKFFTVSVSSLTARDDEEGKLVMLHDITEIYRYQEALKQANTKINLMSNITRHDILNQVNVISGYTELISEVLPPDVKEDRRISKYLRNLNKGIEIIHSQIIFTKDYQELGVVFPTWQSISNIAKEAAFAFSGQGLKFSIEDNGLEIYGDPLLKKVFYNLFDNARNHGEHVSEIDVSSHIEGECVVIEVKDNGIGVPPVMKEHIFEKSVGRNTGLGLFLVRGILSITGMEITETGIEGEGARFEIRVPPENWRRASSQ